MYRIGEHSHPEYFFFLIEKYLTCNIILGLGVQREDLIFVCIVE